VVLAADSSSASANLRISIHKTEWASAGILKVYPAEGPSFFVRDRYLAFCGADLSPERFGSSSLSSVAGDNPLLELDEADTEAVLSAARAFLAERAALEYLARAEQNRSQLALKLARKGYDAVEVETALDYLVESGALDDSRFAGAWLRNRSIHQSEGRPKLVAGLASRGVPMGVARAAVDEFLSDVDENGLCARAAGKLIRLGKTGDSLRHALARKGFSHKAIETSLNDAQTAEKS
jgi:regulatory protein